MSTRAWVVLLVAAASMGCVRRQELVVDGEAEQVQAAAETAVDRLGWTKRLAEDGWLHVVPALDSVNTSFKVRGSHGLLSLEGEARALAAAPLFAATARQVLLGSSGTVPEPRSVGGTVVLDLLFPAAGTLFLGRDDPAMANFGFGLQVVTRLLMDALVVELVVLAAVVATPALAVMMLIEGGLIFLINRVTALMADLPALRLRNDAAARGVGLPTADEVSRARWELRSAP